ncbi:DinB family protein [Streptomyces chumphonensis]|uniref:DinB family protein n=1 Tax=Streptomyces chumphonensis TaxID=1214925 RepID=A0A927F3F1_9ACTN|nr:DinB family protein [Streptomyces chumphonensis]MBD3934032.1 DinB family protein [Streptomyces chumphonensis]
MTNAIPARTDRPTRWDERTTLTTMLDYARATAVAKCADASPDTATAAPLPGSPLMSLAGVLSHLRWVEYWWLRVVFLGEPDDAPWTEDDPDREMRLGARTPLAELVADYEEQSARHRDLVEAHDLDTTARRTGRDGRAVTLRWILLHLVEETARHNGHLDILRELADGTRGS